MRSLAVSGDLTAKLAACKKLLGVDEVRVAFLKEEVLRACSDVMESNKSIAEAFEDSQQRLLRLDIPVAGLGCPEKLVSYVAIEFETANDEVVQKLDQDLSNTLREGLKQTISQHMLFDLWP